MNNPAGIFCQLNSPAGTSSFGTSNFSPTSSFWLPATVFRLTTFNLSALISKLFYIANTMHSFHDFARKQESQLNSSAFGHCVACCYWQGCIPQWIAPKLKGRDCKFKAGKSKWVLTGYFTFATDIGFNGSVCYWHAIQQMFLGKDSVIFLDLFLQGIHATRTDSSCSLILFIHSFIQ